MKARCSERPSVDAAAVKELATGLQGDLLVPGMPDYDSSRAIWNAAIDHHPAIIVRCASTDDVACAVRFVGARTRPCRCGAADITRSGSPLPRAG